MIWLWGRARRNMVFYFLWRTVNQTQDICPMASCVSCLMLSVKPIVWLDTEGMPSLFYKQGPLICVFCFLKCVTWSNFLIFPHFVSSLRYLAFFFFLLWDYSHCTNWLRTVITVSGKVWYLLVWEYLLIKVVSYCSLQQGKDCKQS